MTTAYKKIVITTLFEAAPVSTRASKKAIKLNLVPVGVALYAPKQNAVQNSDSYMWTLKDGYYATHRIENGDLVEIPADENPEVNTSLKSVQLKTQKINQPSDEEKEEDEKLYPKQDRAPRHPRYALLSERRLIPEAHPRISTPASGYSSDFSYGVDYIYGRGELTISETEEESPV